MKKDIKWLKKEFDNLFKLKSILTVGDVNRILSQLDETELPEIPNYVAEYITYMKKEGKTLVEVIYLSLEQIELGTGGVEPIDFWISKFGDKFSRAWLDGFTVKEQKYYIEINGHYLSKGTTKLFLHEGKPKILKYTFTEQEIKDYDKRYIPFMVPVEEMEE